MDENETKIRNLEQALKLARRAFRDQQRVAATRLLLCLFQHLKLSMLMSKCPKGRVCMVALGVHRWTGVRVRLKVTGVFHSWRMDEGCGGL